MLEGELTLTADGHEVTIPALSAARLRSDRAYTYANLGAETTTFLRTVALTR